MENQQQNAECPHCEGVGEISYQRNDGYEGWDACPKCKGTGEVVTLKQRFAFHRQRAGASLAYFFARRDMAKAACIIPEHFYLRLLKCNRFPYGTDFEESA